MRIALASARLIDNDIQHNMMQMERYMREAKIHQADLICFGEAFLHGFNALTWQYEQDRAIAVPTSSAEFIRLKDWSKEIGIDVLFGYNEYADDSIFSSCVIISNGRLLHNYRRISKGWKEYSRTDEHYKEGSKVECFDYKGYRCVIALCGDLWDYPERFALGEDLLFWPVYVSVTKDEWEAGYKQEYAEQAKCCCRRTLYINSICDHDAEGGAALFHDGMVRDALPMGQEGLLYLDL